MGHASHPRVAPARQLRAFHAWRGLHSAASGALVATSLIWIVVFVMAVTPPPAIARADPVISGTFSTSDLSGALRTRDILTRETPPARDETTLARQFRGNSCTDPSPTPVAMWQHADLGERRRFKVLDERNRTYVDVQTTLVGASDHILVYVQDDVPVAKTAVASAIDVFENQTLPVLESTFGPMPSPGRITVFSGHVPGVGGYFSSSDLVPVSLSPNSNARVMVYMNSDVLRPGQAGFDGVLAHEVQHFLHWVRHSQQDSWINEGASELAMVLTGHAQVAPVRSYLRNLETPVTGWAERPIDAVPHYGAASLIMRYLGYRIGGNDRLRAVIETPGVSTQVIDRYLAATWAAPVDAPLSDTGVKGTAAPSPKPPPPPTTFDDLFTDFIAATALDDPRVGDGRFAFGREPILTDKPAPSERLDMSSSVTDERVTTVQTEGTLAPYGTRLIEIAGRSRADHKAARVEIQVDGNATTKAISESPPGDGVFWWGYPADEVFASLTRTVDLRSGPTELSPALEFDAWYDLEQDYDYAGVAISIDGGCSWRAIAGTGTTDTNPIGQNPGNAWTGRSGGGVSAKWTPVRFDLRSAWGHLALIRIFQINDQSFHRSGLAVTNLRVTTDAEPLARANSNLSSGSTANANQAGRLEQGFGEEASPATGAGTGVDWQARGFIATANRVAVTWAVQAIISGGSEDRPSSVGVGQTRVETIPMRLHSDSRSRGTLVVPAAAASNDTKITVALSPMAPATGERTDYRLTVTSIPSE